MNFPMNERRAAVCLRIRNAFAGVRLEDGIGLKEGQGLDDYEDEWVCRNYRKEDEKDDWSVIPAEKLARCHSSLSFFDPKGIRFHLPAYLLAELEGTVSMGTDFHLTRLDDYAKSKLTLLSIEQRGAVRAFLEEIMADPNFEFERPNIERALVTYWDNDSCR